MTGGRWPPTENVRACDQRHAKPNHYPGKDVGQAFEPDGSSRQARKPDLRELLTRRGNMITVFISFGRHRASTYDSPFLRHKRAETIATPDSGIPEAPARTMNSLA